MSKQKWLSLKKAAEQLEVHPTTLRRWADDGAIAVMTTPGGHRRFDVDEVARFATSQRSTNKVDSQWQENALAHTRQGIARRPQITGGQMQSAETRTSFRSLGQQLVGLAMQYMALDEEDESVLEEARGIGKAYGQLGLEMEMALTDILKASLFFHEQLLESSLAMPENNRVRPKANLRILQRTNKLLNAVHLAIADVYQNNL